MNFVGVPYRRGGQRLDRASIAAASRDTSSRTAWASCCRGAPTSRRAMPALARSYATDCGPAIWSSSTRCGAAFSHVGIYVGDGRFIHAPRSGSEVRIEDMRQSLLVAALHRRAPRAAAADSHPVTDIDPARRAGAERAAQSRAWAKPRWATTSFRWPTCATRPRVPRIPEHAAPPTGLLADRAGPAAARPAHLGHRPLQLPLQLLHAQGGLRQRLQRSCRTVRC